MHGVVAAMETELNQYIDWSCLHYYEIFYSKSKTNISFYACKNKNLDNYNLIF